MSLEMDEARKFNTSAEYLPPDPADHDTVPVVVLAGLSIAAYLTDEGELLLAVDGEQAEPALPARLPVVVVVRCVPGQSASLRVDLRERLDSQG